MPTLSKHGKRVGRPPGAAHRDFRPGVVSLVTRAKILEHIVKLYTKEKDNMTVKDQMQYGKCIIEFALAASPKTIETPDQGNHIQLVINGIPQRHHGEDVQLEDQPASEAPCPVQHAPAPRAISEGVTDSRARMPQASANPRPRPVPDSSVPLALDDQPRFPSPIRVPHGPPERVATPPEWREPLFGDD